MSIKTGKCHFCLSDNAEISSQGMFRAFIECPVCGRVEYDSRHINTISKDEYASFLYYKNRGFHDSSRYLYLGEHKDFEIEVKKYPEAHYVSVDEVRAFYPTKFTDKINLILCDIADRSSYIGDIITYSTQQLISACCLKRNDKNNKLLDHDNIMIQLDSILSYLRDNAYIDLGVSPGIFRIMLKAEGWKRVDEIQKLQPFTSKNVFVAMSFADGMEPVRDAIKAALTECGYAPRIMDEIEHNHQIVPEMLYEIREAKFVIAELTGHNNGAYYEAGYALGYGKDVIHVCRKDKFGEDGHFDVKQVNTILWENTEELKTRLVARIKATIS